VGDPSISRSLKDSKSCEYKIFYNINAKNQISLIFRFNGIYSNKGIFIFTKRMPPLTKEMLEFRGLCEAAVTSAGPNTHWYRTQLTNVFYREVGDR